jgi:hypothetical protein
MELGSPGRPAASGQSSSSCSMFKGPVKHSFKSEPRMISTSGVEPRRKYKMDFTIQDELNLREAPKDTGNAYFMKGFTSHLGIKRYSYIFCYIHAYNSLL